MGSPILVVIVEIVMQHVEYKIFQDCPVNITIRKRLVNDVFALIHTKKKESLLGIINSINHSIYNSPWKKKRITFYLFLIYKRKTTEFSE